MDGDRPVAPLSWDDVPCDESESAPLPPEALDFTDVIAQEQNPDNEALFDCLGRTLARLHRKEPPEAQLANIRVRFPTATCFFEASPFMLRRSGIRNLDAFFFSMIPAVARRAGREVLGVRPRLNTLSRMSQFLKALFIGVHVECFYLVMLTATGILIDARLVQRGTVDSAPFYLRETLSLAVNREAKAVVMCHNHPGGTMKPSREDLICTLNMLNSMMAIGLPMLDHVIIAQGRAVSIRETGMLPDALWTMQAPGNRLNRGWLDVELLQEDGKA